MALVGAAVWGLAGIGGVAIFSILRDFVPGLQAHNDDPDSLSVLSPACNNSLLSMVENLGCDEDTSLDIPRHHMTRTVYLHFSITGIRITGLSIPLWNWTSHWAISVGDTFYELGYDKHLPGPKRHRLFVRSTAEREEYLNGKRRGNGGEPGDSDGDGDEERSWTLNPPPYRMGVTHLSDEQLKQTGEAHANNFTWDLLLLNCQAFIHEAYFGKPLVSPPLKKREIRCPEHGSLRPMPTFAGLTLGATFGIVGVAAYSAIPILHLSAITALLAQCVPLVLGGLYFLPTITERLGWSQMVVGFMRRYLAKPLSWAKTARSRRLLQPTSSASDSHEHS